MENPDGVNQVQTKRRPILLWVSIAIALIVVAAGAITYVVLTNKPKTETAANATSAPQIPSKDEVGQIINSLDDKIDQAAADQASASAALNEASKPVKVDI